MASQSNQTDQNPTVRAIQPNQDPTSVYYIHPSDSSTNQLVSVKFNGDGFNNWKRSMMLTLSAKNKLGFVNGTISAPDSASSEYKAWERCNALVISWLLYNLDDNIARSVLFLKTARAIWKDLEERFGYASMPQISSLEHKLAELNQGQQSVSEFYTKLKTIWDNLDDAYPLPVCTCEACTCNLTGRIQKMQQDQRVLQFLMKLNDSFSAVRANILMMTPLLNVTQAYRIVAQEENHKEISQQVSQNDALAFVADKRRFNDTGSQNSQSSKFQPFTNFQKSQNSTFNKKPTNSYYCTHCKMNGHSIERCFRIHGFPPGFKYNKERRVAALSHTPANDSKLEVGADSSSHVPSISPEQYNQLIELLSKQRSTDNSQDSTSGHALLAGKMCLMASFTQEWFLDSGATDHISPHLSDFTSYKAVADVDSSITIPDGSQISVKHIGTVVLNDKITLTNVLHVPAFQYRLLSVYRLCQNMKSNIIFSATQCHLQDPLLKQPPLLLGELNTGLYAVPHQQSSTSSGVTQFFKSPSANLSVSADSKLWHLRMGHLPFSQLKLLQPFCVIKDQIDDTICQICPMAKQTRNSFTTSSTTSTFVFELLHVDVWGPYKVKNHNSCNQFVTIVDDYSRYTWIHLIRFKSDVASVLSSFIAYAENQFSTKVLTIRSDNAKEFTDGPLKLLLQSKGITHQLSCSYTPQQNGVVERKHRHLLETARTLHLQSKLPDHYWGESVLCAAYLINRMPLKSIDLQTPFYRLYKTSPSLDHLRVYGCLCYVSTLKLNRDKFSPRSRPCVFIGYPAQHKAYKVLDLSTSNIVISRDVIFHEHHFPFQMISQLSLSRTQYISSIFIPHTTSTNVHSSHFDDEQQQPSYIFPPVSSFSSPDHSVVNADNSASPSISESTDNSSAHSDHSNNISVPVPRHSTRTRNAPSYLNQYYCNLASLSQTPHWCNLVKYEHMPTSHRAFIAHNQSLVEPISYTHAATQPLWIEAMEKEIKALNDNKTWDIVELPPGKKPIGCKWVYKTKLHADGTLERCKARLVAKGFTQQYGVDYDETFSPVIKMSSVRCLIALAASRKWPLFQLDVNNAFLHGDLTEEVYMQIPPGISHKPNQVCRLRKSLYGLKQASRKWFEKLVSELISLGYKQSKNDYSMFIKRSSTFITIVAVYVDDIIVTGDNSAEIDALKSHLDHVFSIKDLGILHYFLGIEVGYVTDGILLSQKKFSNDILSECDIDFSKPAVTPLPLNLKLSATTGPLFAYPDRYRSLVGKLNYLTNTRPDLSYAVQTLSQYMQAPRLPHFDALCHTLRYVSHTVGQGILLKASNKLTLQAFSDSDWASCVDTRRSITGYIMLFGNSPISWKSKKQTTISRSSSEAEYRAMASAASEVTWLVRLLAELGVDNLQPVTLHCDNQSALYIAKNPVFHERTKHIELDCHFTRDKVLEGLLQLSYLPTQHQLADILTKVVPSPQFRELLSKLGMSQPTSLPASPSPSLRGGIG